MLIRRIRGWVAGFFYFNKQERNGLFLLCVILGLLVLLRLFMPLLYAKADVRTALLQAAPAAETKELSENSPEKKEDAMPVLQAEKFVFNPNEISAGDARKLGFPERLSKTLLNFRNKGGKFFKAEDLKKLYGMSPALYASLEPYILIPGRKPFARRDTVYPKRIYEKKSFAKVPLELNAADSTAIEKLRGIGPAFTRRILKYRSLLGGFHSPEQLREIYGMNDSLYTSLLEQVVFNKALLEKIPVNTADLNTLKKHPYIRFQAAQAIVNYRSKHGKLTEADILSLGVMPEEKLRLLLPYLQY